MRYAVIATVWSDEKFSQIEVVKGIFEKFSDATIFRDAYNIEYSADAVIEDIISRNRYTKYNEIMR